jgi:hypothetical protein
MPRQIQGSQKDFSAGEVDLVLKRADDNPARKAGVRQLSNFRIQSSGSATNRPGRTLLFVQQGRTEQILVAPGVIYRLCFGGDGSLTVRDATGIVVASQPAGTYAWRTATLPQIVWDSVKIGASQVDVVICFPGQKMQIASFDGVSTWTFSAFSFQLDSGGIELVPFFRIAAPGITLVPSSNVGVVNITFSAPVLLPTHVGTLMRYCNIRLRVQTVTSPTTGTALMIDGGADQIVLTIPGGASGLLLGDEIVGQTNGTKAIVSVIYSTTSIGVQCLSNFGSGFAASETVTGPNGSGVVTASSLAAPTPVAVWDEQLFSTARGWPQSVFVDQQRLGFCNMPSVPSAIAWSALGLPYDFDVGQAFPDDAIVELAPFNSQVQFVVPGPESSEFVFCDRAIFYIAISASNPLKPGSVGFQILSNDGSAANVQPRSVQEVIIYVDSGLVTVQSIVATGAFNRPYETRDLADLHTHLIKTPIAIAVPSSSRGFPERYGFVLNSDGTVSVMKYRQQSGQLQGLIGWTPWSGAGSVGWVSALGADVLFSTTYGGVAAVEIMDATQYLDAAFLVNSPPAILAPPVGKGPLWFAPNTSVTLIDQGTRMMGTYQIDANGFIIPQFNAGENLVSATLMAGQPWTAIAEPFAEDAQSGADMHQRMLPRRISYFSVYVVDSTGFVLAKLFSAKQTPTSPPLGTIMNIRRVPAWNQGDDPTAPPPLRETVEEWRPSGHSYDPRVAIIKDTPGPLTILELGMEISI